MVRHSERMSMIIKIEKQLLESADQSNFRYLFDLQDDIEDGVDDKLFVVYNELLNTR